MKEKEPNIYEKKESTEEDFAEQEKLIESMASSLHEDWRAPRRIKDTEKFEPRWKSPKNPDFEEQWLQRLNSGEERENIRIQDGKVEIDIANTPYGELTDAWKEENRVSAEIAIGEVMRAIKEGRKLDGEFIEEASSFIHDKWLERNRDWAPPEQNKPYPELSEEEKEKDRLYVRRAIEMCQSKE